MRSVKVIPWMGREGRKRDRRMANLLIHSIPF